MKKIICLLSALTAFSLAAAEPSGTNTPAATNSFTGAKIPDASHAPVRVTNAVTIAGERVAYTA